MTPHEPDAEQLLGALGELQRVERAELLRLEEPARELAAREPERMQMFEARLLRELCGPQAQQSDRTSAVEPSASSTRPQARRFTAMFSLAAAGCAMAAAALLWVRSPASFDVQYTLVPPAADASTRSAQTTPLPAADAAYSLGRSLTFTLRPSVRYGGALRVLAYAAHEGGASTRLEPRVERDPAGGARVVLTTGPGSQLRSAGSWELQFYISPASSPAVSETQLRARGCPTNTRCLRVRAQLVQPEGS